MKKKVFRNINKDEKSDDVKLVQDAFGTYYYKDGSSVKIKRFTWTNQNRIQIQVINYGARIVSIKYPDRKGHIDDIVLGFDDLAGYINYRQYYFGATIGRMSNVVINSSFKIGDKQYYLLPNTKDGHHGNGGIEGFDQVVWKTWVCGKKVFMTHLSPHGHQGYPGHLLVQISFELSPINEFMIDMVAYSTEPTIVNLTNLLYLNLANHGAGSDSIYKHIVTVNGNCFTKQDENGLCSGDIWNVVHTPLDVQTPIVLGKFMGLVPNDGFYQNMCINRGVMQDECFVAKIRYPPSGRLIEVYSNQYGVQFDTGNHIGKRWPPEEIILPTLISVDPNVVMNDLTMNIIDYLQIKMFERKKEKLDIPYRNFKEYVRLLLEAGYEQVAPHRTSTASQRRISSARKDSTLTIVEDNLQKFSCNSKQLEYLKQIVTYLTDGNWSMDVTWLEQLVEKLIFYGEANAKKSLKLEPTVKPVESISLESTKSIKSEVTSLTNSNPVVPSEKDIRLDQEKPQLEPSHENDTTRESITTWDTVESQKAKEERKEKEWHFKLKTIQIAQT
ncbi:uncharacterized protein LOC130895083 isoform X2 [Diorhabda carinulata]|uniref:uncharacterized protein LOC130895083 isoform X2 n=1 Tax=Diorhabda carinulata TaxID=1163345 RepID=UPI0025A02BBE|nr:uncharacterized protein LOC130895083 isoform X2 [Diorhabda carinulata]